MKQWQQTLKFWSPPVVWAGFIFYISSLSQVTPAYGGLFEYIITYGGHFTEYLVLAFLVRRALVKTTSMVYYQYALWSLLIAVFYAITDEWHQSFVPSRDASIVDVAFDSLGSVVAVWLLPWLEHKLVKSKP